MYKVWVLYYLLQIMMISQTGLDASSSLRKIKGKKIGQIAAVHPRPSTQVSNRAPPHILTDAVQMHLSSSFGHFIT